MAALELQRLVVRDLRAEDVAGAGAPLAVRADRFLGSLVVHGDLALELHVVEHRHPVAADDSQLPHLVRIEPREMHVRDLPGRELEVAEDDVLDAGSEKGMTLGERGRRLLADQVEDHGKVVHAERPQRVLVLADHTEVLPVAVDAQHVAELAGVDQRLQLVHAGVVEQ